MTKNSLKWSLKIVGEKFHEIISRYGYKEKEVYFSSIPIFKPLEMESLTRVELEKFLKAMFEPRFSEPIISVFFTKRNEFKNPQEYFYEVEKLMKKFTSFAYYFAFPQLIRFMKDENKMKKLMDKYYAQSLHSVKIRNEFVFHS